MKTIGIFCHGQGGDCAVITGAFKYRNELWGDDHKIVWYIDPANADLLKFQDVEVRDFPRGFGHPDLVINENRKLEGSDLPKWADWFPLVNGINHMNLELKKNYPELADIDYGYFPAPHQIPVHLRHGWEYSNCSKNVFGIPENYKWHPVLKYSEEESEAVKMFLDLLLAAKVICIESFAGSGQSLMSDKQIRRTMDICREELGQCNFVFVSHKYLNGNEKFPEDILAMEDVFTASHFTVRQCGLLVGYSDLLVSVSSGITVASSHWGNKPTPIVQFAGSWICSTKSIALGEFHLITYDDKPLHIAVSQYEDIVRQTLKTI